MDVIHGSLAELRALPAESLFSGAEGALMMLRLIIKPKSKAVLRVLFSKKTIP